MKPPPWFRQQLAAEGRQVLERAITDEEAAARLAKAILGNPSFAQRVVGDYARRQVKTWTAQHRPGSATGDGHGQLDLFPELPRHVEVSPGRFVDQAAMTRRDWDAALRQAQTKAANASGHYEAVRRAYDKVRPLLIDDETTTAAALADRPDTAAVGR